MKWYIGKPNVCVGCRNKDVYIMAIPLDQAIVTKAGSDLIKEMPDGKKITFQRFYCKDVSFMVNDRILTPEDFFALIKTVDVMFEDGAEYSEADMDDDKSYEEYLASCTFSPEDEERLKDFLSSGPDEPDPSFFDQPDEPDPDFFNHVDDSDPYDQPDDPPFI